MSIKRERELTYFVEVTQPENLDKAEDMELHEQWEYRLPGRSSHESFGRVRVRKLTKDEKITYSQTVKPSKTEANLMDDVEATTIINEEYFELWKKLFDGIGFFKTRYTFKANKVKAVYKEREFVFDSIKFELDFFKSADGTVSKWARCDIEIQDVTESFKKLKKEAGLHIEFKIDFSQLPLGIKRVVSHDSIDDEEQAAITRFYKTYQHRLS